MAHAQLRPPTTKFCERKFKIACYTPKQMQQAYLMQQQALAIQKAQKAEAKHAVRLANAEKHRAEQAAAREAAKEKRGNSLK